MPRKNRREPRVLRAAGAGGAARTRPTRRRGRRRRATRSATVGGQKAYRCPGCDHEVRAGVWHLVVVPGGDVDARRHWHTECWRRELRRQGLYRAVGFRGRVGAAGYDGPMEPSTATDPAACIAVNESKRLPCDLCGHPMEPEHAHYRCPACHYILPCCGW